MKLGGANVAAGTRSERISLDHVIEGKLWPLTATYTRN
jgi:hypothetical protein